MDDSSHTCVENYVSVDSYKCGESKCCPVILVTVLNN